MVKCEHCGYDNKDESKYCVHCSKKLLTNNFNETLFSEDEQEDNELKDLYYTFLEDQRYQEITQPQQANIEENYIQEENQQFNQQLPEVDNPYEIKDPDFNPHKTTSRIFIATTLSAIICGLGYVYLGDSRRCAMLLVSELIVYVIAFIAFRSLYSITLEVLLYIVSMLIYIIGIISTYYSAREY